MKIENVKNGYIVEVEIKNDLIMTASGTSRFNTEKHIFINLAKLLDFISNHYEQIIKEPKQSAK